MKKILLFVFCILSSISVLAGCTLSNGTETFDTYFKNFISRDGYTQADVLLNLNDYEEFEGRAIVFSSYDYESGIYIMKEQGLKFGDVQTTLYGFATIEEGILIAPRYEAVLDINGDYAIVARRVAVGDISQTIVYIGVVKIRGENAGKEYGFSYTYMPAITQYMFLNENLLVVLGNMRMESGEDTSIAYTYATIYDYSSTNGKAMMQIATIIDVANLTTFKYFDGNVISTYMNIVRFYRITEIGSDGVLVLKGYYSPFDLDSGYTESLIVTDTSYIGNNWFLISGVHTSTTDTGIYDMIEYDSNGSAKYITIKSASYTTQRYKSFEIKDRIALVANKYSDDIVRSMADLLNSSYDVDEFDAKGKYYTPVVPMSSAIKDGYSIVYYYYYQQIDGLSSWPVTYAIYNTDARGTDLDTIMPLLFVDGIGLYNGDPNFPLVAMSADYHTYYGIRVILEEITDYVGFNTAIAHDDMIISFNLIQSGLTSDTYAGAYTKSGYLAVPYIYFELTPFFGGYATGSRITGGTSDTARSFYKINKNGAEELLEDVYILRNGVYVTYVGEGDDTRYGLKANSGKVLIENRCTSVSTIDTFLTDDGYYISSVVVTIQEGLGVIYQLK
ncbi:MAG: hypothetical protein LBF68_05050 [Christensenellaceae bacterium]|jgi:hypothetical protein|nr:hypothetical protein [Christensenellaceae bacterium]